MTQPISSNTTSVRLPMPRLANNTSMTPDTVHEVASFLDPNCPDSLKSLTRLDRLNRACHVKVRPFLDLHKQLLIVNPRTDNGRSLGIYCIPDKQPAIHSSLKLGDSNSFTIVGFKDRLVLNDGEDQPCLVGDKRLISMCDDIQDEGVFDGDYFYRLSKEEACLSKFRVDKDDLTNRELIWESFTPNNGNFCSSRPFVFGNRVYVSSVVGFYIFNKETGQCVFSKYEIDDVGADDPLMVHSFIPMPNGDVCVISKDENVEQGTRGYVKFQMVPSNVQVDSDLNFPHYLLREEETVFSFSNMIATWDNKVIAFDKNQLYVLDLYRNQRRIIPLSLPSQSSDTELSSLESMSLDCYSRLYFNTNHSVFQVDLTATKPQAKLLFKSDKTIRSFAPDYANQRGLLGSDDGCIVAFDFSGDTLWSYDMKTEEAVDLMVPSHNYIVASSKTTVKMLCVAK